MASIWCLFLSHTRENCGNWKETIEMRRGSPAGRDEHDSHSVSALESLLSAYLLAGYELSRKGSNAYIGSLLNHVVRFVCPGLQKLQTLSGVFGTVEGGACDVAENRRPFAEWGKNPHCR